eukprot:959071_1
MTVYNTSEVVRNQTSRSNRYITDYQTRLLAQRWYQTRFTKYRREKKLDKLKRNEYRKLKNQLKEHALDALHDLIEWIDENIDSIHEDDQFCKDLQDVIRAIIGNECCFGIFHQQIHYYMDCYSQIIEVSWNYPIHLRKC